MKYIVDVDSGQQNVVRNSVQSTVFYNSHEWQRTCSRNLSSSWQAGFAPWGDNSDVLSNHWHMCTTCDVHLTHYILNGDTGFCKIPNVTIVSRFACDVPLAEPLIIHPVPRSMETDLVSPRPSTVLCWPCPISTTPISTGGPTFGTVPAKWS